MADSLYKDSQENLRGKSDVEALKSVSVLFDLPFICFSALDLRDAYFVISHTKSFFPCLPLQYRYLFCRRSDPLQTNIAMPLGKAAGAIFSLQ